MWYRLGCAHARIAIWDQIPVKIVQVQIWLGNKNPEISESRHILNFFFRLLAGMTQYRSPSMTAISMSIQVWSTACAENFGGKILNPHISETVIATTGSSQASTLGVPESILKILRAIRLRKFWRKSTSKIGPFVPLADKNGNSDLDPDRFKMTGIYVARFCQELMVLRSSRVGRNRASVGRSGPR